LATAGTQQEGRRRRREMNLATFANDRLAIVKREPRLYAIRGDYGTLIRHGGHWMLTGSLDDRYVSSHEAIQLAAMGKIIDRTKSVGK